MRLNSHLILSITMLIICSLSVNAQRKSNNKTNRKVELHELSKEQINFEKLLYSTAKVMFIDSTLLTQQAMADSIPLSKSSGNIEIHKDGASYVYQYTNELKTLKIISKTDETGYHRLYLSTKLGNNWELPELIEIPGDYKDLICPYMLSDGLTLYFSAYGGEDNIGKHDIFFTIYDTDENKYIMPQSIGLPYNSQHDDYYYLIDEENALGYLATSRNTDSTKVFSYIFVPTETREFYDMNELGDEAVLKRFALLHSISSTQANKEILESSLKRYALMCDKTTNKTNNERFYLTKNKYLVNSDNNNYKTKSGIDDFIKQKQALNEKEYRLKALRNNYRNGQRYTKNEIIDLEKDIIKDRKMLKKQSSFIRQSLSKR